MDMATLEQGDTPSCSISGSDERKLQRLGLENNGISGVFSRGLTAMEDKEELKRMKKEFDQGNINLGQLLKEIELL